MEAKKKSFIRKHPLISLGIFAFISASFINGLSVSDSNSQEREAAGIAKQNIKPVQEQPSKQLVEQKAEPRNQEAKFNIDEAIKKSSELRKEIDNHLKQYYGLERQIRQINAIEKDFISNIVQINEENKADAVIKETQQLEVLKRRLYASISQERMFSSGKNIYFTTSGKNHDTLTVEYVLMSDALVYQLINKNNFLDQPSLIGFKKIVFKDGYNFVATQTIN